jgi:lantibiotic biosynthesis protein
MNSKIPYVFNTGLILRTPAFPFIPAKNGEDAGAMLKKDYFLEAIYLASPVLYDECVKLANGQITDEKEKAKILQSAMKYWQRMYSRCTPFGLFSGCSTIEWTDELSQITINEAKRQRHTRLDMHFLCALSQNLATLPDIKKRLRYFPNNSWYKTADEIRYIEYKYVNGNRHHQISAAASSDYLEDILQHAANGITIPQMVERLLPLDVTEEEAMEFIDELLESQVLVNELEPAITGPEFIYQLLETLRQLNNPANETIENIIHILEQIDDRIKKIDQNSANPVSAYKEIIELVKQTGVAFEESKLFQTDMVQQTEAAHLSVAHQESLTGAITALNALMGNHFSEENLRGFVQRFYERYEDKEMQLLQVLDAETGIGYLQQTGRNPSVLIEDIFPGAPAEESFRDVKWGKTQTWLLDKLQEATRNNRFEVEITETDLKDLKPVWKNLPPSMSVMFRLVNEEQLVFESAGGSSAANLLARFAHGDEKIKEIICDTTEKEQQNNPGILFAEIVHLPESRVGNILLHPVFRGYEIPFLAKSSLPTEQQIDLRDLYVSVQGNRVILRSASLNKEIIPRLSSAHNFSFNALPVYQFLCDLQTNGLQGGFGFQWGALSGQFMFLPRVTYKNVILFEATWQLDKKHTEQLTNALKQKDPAFIKQVRLPQLITLSDGDNELLVDIENEASVAAFLKTIKNRTSIVLKEFISGGTAAISNTEGVPFVNQFIASLVKTETVYDRQLNPSSPQTTRSFVPGSEWFYYKIYCGVNTAEKILDLHLEPVIRQLEEQGLIEKWFFIRYTDPGFHLRIRFLAKTPEAKLAIENMLAEPLVQIHNEGLSWKIQMDTYNRELERYGDALIDESESLFCIDSYLKLDFLRQTEGDEREKIRWLWGMKNADWLLECFAFTPAEKEELLRKVKEQFGREFNFGKPALQEINKKFGKYRTEMMQVMQPKIEEEPLVPLQMFEGYRAAMTELATRIKDKSGNKIEVLESLLHSYLHMCLNRLFPAEPRLQEAVMYEFLHKYYVTQRYRKETA